MPAIVRTGAALRALLDGQQEVRAQGTTIRAILENLGILERICDEAGKVRRHFNIHVNEGEDIRLLAGLDTPVRDGDSVTILSAIAGGAEVTRKLWLTYPKEMVDRPLVWEVGQRFKVVTNIRQANLKRSLGLVGLEMTGEESEVRRALSYIEQQGVKVEPVELDVME